MGVWIEANLAAGKLPKQLGIYLVNFKPDHLPNLYHHIQGHLQCIAAIHVWGIYLSIQIWG
jgi:hypothetical protein